MENKIKTDLSKYIVNVQGKDFITFPGLLAEAHSQGLLAVETQMINEDFKNPVMKATVHMRGESLPSGQHQVKLFTGYGDANENNVAKKVAGALIRMAETRAIARALRFACNIDMTALEEIGADDDEVKPASIPPKTFKRAVSVTADGPVDVPVAPNSSGSVTIQVSGPDSTGKMSTTVVPEVATPNDTSQVQEKFVKRTFNKRPTQTKEPNFPG